MPEERVFPMKGLLFVTNGNLDFLARLTS